VPDVARCRIDGGTLDLREAAGETPAVLKADAR
jgi:hypothetical protein